MILDQKKKPSENACHKFANSELNNIKEFWNPRKWRIHIIIQATRLLMSLGFTHHAQFTRNIFFPAFREKKTDSFATLIPFRLFLSFVQSLLPFQFTFFACALLLKTWQFLPKKLHYIDDAFFFSVSQFLMKSVFFPIFCVFFFPAFDQGNTLTLLNSSS